MAYKTFVAGEEATAADVNSLLMAQTVARFATAAARTSAIPAPVLNQMTVLDSRPGRVQYWTGSAWADVLPVEQEVYQAGATFPPNTAAGIITVTGTIPSPGKLYFQGLVLCRGTGTVGTQTVTCVVDSTSTPAPNLAPASVFYEGADFKTVTIPIFAVCNTAVAGPLSLKVRITVGGGPPSVIVDFVTGSWRLV